MHGLGNIGLRVYNLFFFNHSAQIQDFPTSSNWTSDWSPSLSLKSSFKENFKVTQWESSELVFNFFFLLLITRIKSVWLKMFCTTTNEALLFLYFVRINLFFYIFFVCFLLLYDKICSFLSKSVWDHLFRFFNIFFFKFSQESCLYRLSTNNYMA